MKLTPTQVKIFERFPIKQGGEEEYYPITGSGEHRSARSLERQGFARVVAIPFRRSRCHFTDYFIILQDGYRVEWDTKRPYRIAEDPA